MCPLLAKWWVANVQTSQIHIHINLNLLWILMFLIVDNEDKTQWNKGKMNVELNKTMIQNLEKCKVHSFMV